MRKIIIIFIILGAYFSINAQSIERSVISSGGLSFNNSNYSIDWTFGETSVSTASGGSTLLTQGFNQYYTNSINLINVIDIQGLKSFPNPTNDVVSFFIENNNSIALIKLYDVSGKLLISQDWNTTEILTIDLASYASGIYHFQIIIEGKTNAIKVSKI